MSKEKFISNPKRKIKQTYKISPPNYVELDIEPVRFNWQKVPKGTNTYIGPTTDNNPRIKSKLNVQPQEETIYVKDESDNDFPIYKIPNIGNNEERTWERGFDLIDDMNLNQNSNQSNDSDMEVDAEDIKEYVLLYKGNIYFTGSFEEVEKQVQDILYGENIEFKNKEISVHDLVVLKKLKIKAGIYITE